MEGDAGIEGAATTGRLGGRVRMQIHQTYRREAKTAVYPAKVKVN